MQAAIGGCILGFAIGGLWGRRRGQRTPDPAGAAGRRNAGNRSRRLMAHGLALDHAAWSSPWRVRSVRDKGVLSGGLLLGAITLPAVPGGAAGGDQPDSSCSTIRVGWARLGRIVWLPLTSIPIGVATVAVSVSWDAGRGCR